jgi:hypothetical protein
MLTRSKQLNCMARSSGDERNNQFAVRASPKSPKQLGDGTAGQAIIREFAAAFTIRKD